MSTPPGRLFKNIRYIRPKKLFDYPYQPTTKNVKSRVTPHLLMMIRKKCKASVRKYFFVFQYKYMTKKSQFIPLFWQHIEFKFSLTFPCLHSSVCFYFWSGIEGEEREKQKQKLTNRPTKSDQLTHTAECDPINKGVYQISDQPTHTSNFYGQSNNIFRPYHKLSVSAQYIVNTIIDPMLM